MKWSDKDFRARVEAHTQRLGLTLTEVLERAGLTEDYLRRIPAVGRNVGAILAIAEVLEVNAAELMGLELPSAERRSMTMIAHIMAHLHVNIMRANGDQQMGAGDIEKIAVAMMSALKEHSSSPTAKTRSKTGAAAKPKKSE